MSTVSSKRELYKAKSSRCGGGLGNREARAKQKAVESKSGREAVLMSRRRIPLSEVQEESRKKKGELAGSDLRLQRLKEWRAKRDEARQKEKASKKKPFSCGGRRPGMTGHTTGSKAASNLQPRSDVSKIAKPITATRPKNGSETAPKSEFETPSVGAGKTQRGATAKPPVPTQHTAPAAENKTNAKTKKDTVSSNKPPQPTAPRASKRIAARQATEPEKELVSPTQAHAESQPGNNKERVAKAAVKVSENAPTRVTRSIAAKSAAGRGGATSAVSREEGVKKATSKKKCGKKRVNNADEVGPSGKKRVKRDSPTVSTKLTYSDSSSESTDTASPPQSFIPPSNTQHHAPTPLPSRSHSNKSVVPDSAWVAHHQISSRSSSSLHTINAILGPATFIPFSPFKFTASHARTPVGQRKRRETPGKSAPFVFSFRKTVDQSPSSLQAEMMRQMETVQSDVTSDAISIDSLECCPPTPVTGAPTTIGTPEVCAGTGAPNTIGTPGAPDATVTSEECLTVAKGTPTACDTPPSIATVTSEECITGAPIDMGTPTVLYDSEATEASEDFITGPYVVESAAEETVTTTIKQVKHYVVDSVESEEVVPLIADTDSSQEDTEGESEMVFLPTTGMPPAPYADPAVSTPDEVVPPTVPTAEEVVLPTAEVPTIPTAEEVPPTIPTAEEVVPPTIPTAEEVVPPTIPTGGVPTAEEVVPPTIPTAAEPVVLPTAPSPALLTTDSEMVCGEEGEGGESEDKTGVVEGEISEEDCAGHTSSNTGETAGIDFAYFHRLHDDAASNLASQCSVWREKGQSLETLVEQRQQQQEDGEEEVSHLIEGVDLIRTTVCQAELLVRKKMKQYLGLVTEAEGAAEDSNCNTTAEDLQGFWDLVSMQVEDVGQKFKCLKELEGNDWRQPQMMEKNWNKKRVKKQTRQSSAVKSTGVVSEKQVAARERRNAMRSRLKEMMKAQAAAKRTGETESGVETGNSGSIEPTTTTTTTTAGGEPATPPPPPGEGVTGGGGGSRSKSSKRRKSTGKRRSRRFGRRSSVALINFSDGSPATTAKVNPPLSPTTHHSVFSPAQPNTSSNTAPNSGEVPIGNLLSFTTQQASLPPMKSPLKWVPEGLSTTRPPVPPLPGASVRRFASITPSKRVRELMGADVLMSPVRRSLRLTNKSDTPGDSRRGNYQVSSLAELPDELDIGYLPNKALFY